MMWAPDTLVGRTIRRVQHVDYDNTILPWPEHDWEDPRHLLITFWDGSTLKVGGACHDESRLDLDFKESA